MIGKLQLVALDAADITGLSRFYQDLAGWTEDHAGSGWIELVTPEGWRIALQESPDHRPPSWPGQEQPQQAHLDLRVPDLDAALARVEELGGRLLAKSEAWYTVADPAGHPFDLCRNDEVTGPSLMGVMLDVPDAKALTAFYAELLGKAVTFEADGMGMIGEDGAQPVLFQQVDDYTAPQWPNPEHPQQVHLDVEVDDLEAAEAGALKLGATRLPGGTDSFWVFADPAGKPFCLVKSS